MNAAWTSCLAILCALVLSPIVVAAGAEATLVVEVRGPSGVRVADSHVAVIPMWRAWSDPLVEEMSRTGISTFTVPPGTYHVTASARGFGIGVAESVKGSTASPAKVTVVLHPLQPVSGTIADAQGRPIAGARIATVHGAVTPPLGRMSRLAARHLAGDWSTTTDADGQWRLSVPAGTVPLFFEAPGHAAQWRVRSAGATIMDLQLERGSELTVTADRADPDLALILSPDDGAATQILAEEQESVWARFVGERVVRWRSVAPGTYGIYAKYPDPLFFQAIRTRIATVHLDPGRSVDLQVKLPPVRQRVTNARALFFWAISPGRLNDLQVFGGGAATHLEHVLEEVVDGTVVRVRGDDAKPPFYAITAARFFSTVHDLADPRVTPRAEPSLVVAHPRADAHFAVRFMEPDLPRPTRGMAILRQCRNAAVVRTLVQIRNDVGQLTAPAGCEGFLIELPPYEPVIATRSLIEGDQSLGELLLRASASADVRVVREPGGTVVPSATVRATSAETSDGRALILHEATTDDTGWASLTGLPAYWNLRITAETAEGDAAAGVDLRVEPRQKAVVDPLVIPAPAALIVDARLDPAFASRFPQARLVQVMARPADPKRSNEQRQENVADAAKPLRFERLHAGRWLVTAAVIVGGTYAPVDVDEVDLQAGEERRIERTLSPGVYDGIVRMKGEPVAAKVMVQDRGRTLSVNTAADGTFRLALQEAGTYAVAVARQSTQGNVIPVGRVPFIDPAQRVEIALPEPGRATVRVRRGEQPESDISVWISQRDAAGATDAISSRARATDANGETAFEDLAPGVWTFTVRDTTLRRGAEKNLAVAAGERIAVDLELAETASLRGSVRDLRGAPLPRARVDCAFVGAAGIPGRVTGETDGHGAFDLQLVPPAPREALCGVVGPAGTADAFRAVPDRAVTLTVAAASGAVRFTGWSAQRDGNVWLVADDGRVIPLDAAAARIGAFGQPLAIPALAAGSWKVIRASSTAERLAVARGMAAMLPAVAQIRVRPGSTETIQLR